MSLKGVLGQSTGPSGALGVAVLRVGDSGGGDPIPELELVSALVHIGLVDVTFDDPDEEPFVEPVSTLVAFP